MDRRTALVNLSSLGAAVALGTLERANAERSGDPPRARNLRTIATEEACTIPEVATELREVVRAGGSNLDLPLLATIYDAPAGTQPRFLPELLDLDSQRLADMDRHGVQMHLLALTAPGVQMFDADTATSLARVANDRLSELVRRATGPSWRGPKRSTRRCTITRGRLPTGWRVHFATIAWRVRPGVMA